MEFLINILRGLLIILAAPALIIVVLVLPILFIVTYVEYIIPIVLTFILCWLILLLLAVLEKYRK